MGEVDPSYYSVLHVSREASDDDIKKAFRNLAQTYHPDKHSDPVLKAEASASFTSLQEAYEVWTIMLATVAHAGMPCLRQHGLQQPGCTSHIK